MTTSDAPEFKRLVMKLDTVFDKASSTVKVDAYFEELRDIPLSLVAEAVSRHIRRARTYPRPAELRKLADEAQGIDEPRKALPAHKPAEPEAIVRHCAECEDNGWLPTTMKAPVYGPEATVEAVKRCPCYKTNPNLVTAKRYAHRDADFSRSW